MKKIKILKHSQKIKIEKNQIINNKLKKLNVLCILGKSGTGKSTLIDYMMNKFPEKYHYVKSYTTRKVRENDPNDKNTHIFVDKRHFKKYKKKNEIIATYNSPLNYVSYTTIHSFDKNKINLYAIDVKAFNKLQLKEAGIYLYLSEDERKKRKTKRDKEMEYDFEEHLDKKYLKNKARIIDINNKSTAEIMEQIYVCE